jgi:hemerythrin-like metal-binding protein
MIEKKLIIWSEGYSVGIKDIDMQHMKLIDLINKLYYLFLNKNYDDLKNIMKELKDYTLYHFSTEERLFREKKYSNELEHIAKHEELVNQLNTLINEFINSPSVLTMKTMTFLQKWLTNHIMKEDKKYVGYLD